MSEIVKLGNISHPPIEKLANAINKIPNTDEGIRNAIKVVKEEQILTDEVMSKYMNKQMGDTENSKQNMVRDTRRAMFDGTGNAARTVNERLNEDFER